MGNRHLLFEIVDALETEGLGRDEYQLQRVIDVEALEQLVDSANDDLEIRFSVGEFRVFVTQSDVRIRKLAMLKFATFDGFYTTNRSV